MPVLLSRLLDVHVAYMMADSDGIACANMFLCLLFGSDSKFVENIQYMYFGLYAKRTESQAQHELQARQI